MIDRFLHTSIQVHPFKEINESMNAVLNTLLPAKADNRIRGSRLPFYIFILIATVGAFRSCVHIFTPDGGAGSIAGMDLSVTGANEVIFAFALWGAEQLIYALLQWLVILRYRSLVPFMWLVQLLEVLGRMLVGRLKPVTFAHTPPGEIGNYVFLVVSLLMIVLALGSGMKDTHPNPFNERSRGEMPN